MQSIAFGPYAKAYAKRLPDELHLLVFDEIGFAEGLDYALERLYSFGTLMTQPIITDRRTKVAFDAIEVIVTANSDYWRRRECLEMLRIRKYVFNGRTQDEHEAFTKKEKDSIRDVLLASNIVVIRSWAEVRRLSDLLDVQPIRTRRAIAKPSVPVPKFCATRSADTIVVWAPELDALRASLFALALEELKSPVVVACANPAGVESLQLRAVFIDATDALQLEPFLEKTAVIIDGSPEDPAAALELALLGLPLGASLGSGAYEYIDGVYSYHAWDFRSILHSALAGLGGEPPRVRGAIPRPQNIIEDMPNLAPPEIKNTPLVSVIVPTRNRHGILPRAIDSLRRQTYPNIEAIIVNDGGAPVDAIVDCLPNVTVINNLRPIGPLSAFVAAMRLATGEYLFGLSDDDYLYPTALSRLVYALERTGATVAAGMTSNAVLVPGESPYYDFIGTSICAHGSTDPTILRGNPAAAPAALIRRKAEEAYRTPVEWTAFSDYFYTLCLLERYDFIWVSHVIFNMDSRLDRSAFSGKHSSDDRAADLSRIWSQHEAFERPDIGAARETILQLYRSNAAGPLFPIHRGVTRIERPKPKVYRLD